MNIKGLAFESAPKWTFFGQTRSFAFNTLAILCLVAVVAYGAGLGLQMSASISETQDINTKVVAAKLAADQARKQKRPPEAQPATAVALNQSLEDGKLTAKGRAQLNQAVRQLNVPWHDIFVQLEASTPPDIAILGIEPDGQQGIIRVRTEAKSLDSLLRHAGKLENSGVFGKLTYLKHVTNDLDANHPVRLSFQLVLAQPQRVVDALAGRQP